MKSDRFHPGVVILAAGASSRMGVPKLLLPWNNTTVLHHLVLQWRRIAQDQVAVVYAAHQEGIAAELNRIGFSPRHHVFNPAPEHGMFSSIQAAARWAGWAPEVTHVGIALGDQPHLLDSTLRELTQFASEHPSKICQPSRSGRARHPVILPRAVFSELASTAHETLKEFLDGHSDQRVRIEIDDHGLDLDLDTPADYQAALHFQTIRNERQ
jgi:molybdenum cofactor cytidylyltransferase